MARDTFLPLQLQKELRRLPMHLSQRPLGAGHGLLFLMQ